MLTVKADTVYWDVDCETGNFTDYFTGTGSFQTVAAANGTWGLQENDQSATNYTPIITDWTRVRINLQVNKSAWDVTDAARVRLYNSTGQYNYEIGESVDYSPDDLIVVCRDQTGTIINLSVSSGPDYDWHKYEMVYDSGTGNVTMYVDGVSKLTTCAYHELRYSFTQTVFGSTLHTDDYYIVKENDTTPPVIDDSSWNVSSAINADNQTIWQTAKTTASITTDSTPTVLFDLDEVANCSISKTDGNYTNMTTDDVNTKCATTDADTMSCTLPSTQELVQGEQNIYTACIDNVGNENATSSSGALNIKLDSSLYPGSGNWDLNCSLGLNITENADVLGNNVSTSDTGIVTLQANITNFDTIFLTGIDSSNRCTIECESGCFQN